MGLFYNDLLFFCNKMRYSALIITTLALFNFVITAPITNTDVTAVKDISDVRPHLIPIAKRKVSKRTAEDETIPSPAVAEGETDAPPAEGEEENSTLPVAAEDNNSATPVAAEDGNNAAPVAAEDENGASSVETEEETNNGRRRTFSGSKNHLQGLTGLLKSLTDVLNNGVGSENVSDDPKTPHQARGLLDNDFGIGKATGLLDKKGTGKVVPEIKPPVDVANLGRSVVKPGGHGL